MRAGWRNVSTAIGLLLTATGFTGVKAETPITSLGMDTWNIVSPGSSCTREIKFYAREHFTITSAAENLTGSYYFTPDNDGRDELVLSVTYDNILPNCDGLMEDDAEKKIRFFVTFPDDKSNDRGSPRVMLWHSSQTGGKVIAVVYKAEEFKL